MVLCFKQPRLEEVTPSILLVTYSKNKTPNIANSSMGKIMKILQCRRTVVALTGLLFLLVLGLTKTIEVSSHIVAIVVAIAGANAAQGIMEKK